MYDLYGFENYKQKANNNKHQKHLVKKKYELKTYVCVLYNVVKETITVKTTFRNNDFNVRHFFPSSTW